MNREHTSMRALLFALLVVPNAMVFRAREVHSMRVRVTWDKASRSSHAPPGARPSQGSYSRVGRVSGVSWMRKMSKISRMSRIRSVSRISAINGLSRQLG